ncbi:hypothetical protein, partial [Pseudomonas sp. 2822-15]|uniref:hypothetical protein n=1 Tax=Pseudomonas sp. 2822-15 TaxID=1712677 RepID=UPI001C471BF6
DISKNILPNWLTMSGVLVGLLLHIIMDGLNGLLFSILGLVAAGGILLILYLFKALGLDTLNFLQRLEH